MPIVFRLALACDLLAIWIEAAFPQLASLPITGSHVKQLAIFLLAAIVILEFHELTKPITSAIFTRLTKRSAAEPET